MATLKLVEVMSALNERSSLGRVVINPPKRMAPLKPHLVGEIKICCGRAFLTEESFNRHRLERGNEHLNDLWNDKLIMDEDFNVAKTKAHSSSTTPQGKQRQENFNKNISVTSSIKRCRKGNVTKCTLCGILTSKVNYGRHLKKAHDPASKFKCKWCACKFPTKQSALRHSSRTHPIEHKKFCWNAASQNKHVISARKMTSVVKTVSKQSAPNKIAETMAHSSEDDVLRQESVEATNQVYSIKKRKKVHECIFCGKVLKNKISFQHHLLIHTGDRPYKCKLCENSFRHTGNLSRHYKTMHSDELKFQCALCPSRFHTQGTLLEHMRRKHKESFVPNDIILRSPNPRMRKKRMTSKKMQNMEPIKVENGYQCGICGKVLKHLLTYQGHRLIHTNSFPHKCPQCNAKFRLKTTLVTHLETNHVENGSSKCTLCTCAFKSPRGLTRHMQWYHSGKRKRHSFAAKEKVVKKEIPRPTVERSVSPDISTLGTSSSAPKRFPEAAFKRKVKEHIERNSEIEYSPTNSAKRKFLESSHELQKKKKTVNVSSIGHERKSLSNKIAEGLSQRPEQPTINNLQNVASTSSKPIEPGTQKTTKKRKQARSTFTRRKKNKNVANGEIKTAKHENKEVTIKSRSPEREKRAPPCNSPKLNMHSPKRVILKISKRKLLANEHFESKLELKRKRQQPKDLYSQDVTETAEDITATQTISVVKKVTRGRRKKPEPPDLQCKVCLKTFASPQCKRLHETIHTGKMEYSCDYCNQQFRLFSTFHFHIKRFENPRGNFLCALCISRCGSEEALNHHMAIHKYKQRNYNKLQT